MKKLLLVFISVTTLVLGCDSNQDYFLTENLIGTWEGIYPFETEHDNTYIEYTFKNDGSYEEVHKVYSSEGELIGFKIAEQGSYLVKNENLEINAFGGFHAKDSENLPISLGNLKEDGSYYIIDGFPSRYSFSFEKNFRKLYIETSCIRGTCQVGPLDKISG